MHRVDPSLHRRRTAMLGVLAATVVGALARADAALASAGGEQSVSDPERSRVVTGAILAMVAVGLLVVLVTIWFWKTTRPEPPVLGPLEVMGERSFARADAPERERRLALVRPESSEAADDDVVLVAPSARAATDLTSSATAAADAERPAEPEAESSVVAAVTPPVDAAPEPDVVVDDTDVVDDVEAGPGDHTPDGAMQPEGADDETRATTIDPLLGKFL